MSLERDSSTREELWADVLRSAFDHLEELEPLSPGQVRSWLLQTARYLTANSTRRAIAWRRLLDRLSQEPPEPTSSAEDEFLGHDDPDKREVGRLAGVAWRGLSESYREILTLDALGQKGPQIAELLGVTHQAARLRLMRARAAFAKAYEDLGGSPEPGAGPK